MSRRRNELVVAVLVVVLVFAPGCTALTGSITDTPAPTPTQSPTTTPTPTATATPTPTPTLTPSPTSTPTATPSPTPTPTPSARENWEQLLSSHERTLESADQWGGVFSVAIVGDEAALRPGDENVTVAVAVDEPERRRFVLRDDRRVDTFTAGTDSPTYTRINETGDLRYTRGDGEVVVSEFQTPPFDADFLAGWDYTDEGVVETDRGPRRKFTAQGADAMSDETKADVDGEVRDASISIYVDTERGLVTRMDYTVTVERSGGTVTAAILFRVFDVGDSQVTQPDWLDEARDRTG